jgi:hypothetical protein
MTFGIPVNKFPITDDLQIIKRQKHQKWITTRRHLELKRKRDSLNSMNSSGNISSNSSSQNNSQPSVILLPSHADVLFGRGKPVREHPGNLALGALVESLLLRYNACNGKEMKRLITQEVINKIKSRGGKFVKQVDGVWADVDEKTVREKVSHTFRNKKQDALKEACSTRKRARGV